MAKKGKSKNEYYTELATVIDGKAGPFPATFYKTRWEEGKYLILRQVEESGIVVASNKEDVADEIMKYASANPHCGVKTDKDAAGAVRWWLAVGDNVPMPEPFLWMDEFGLTFSRLPWAKGVDGPKPTWGGVWARTTNAAAMRAFIGSVFDKDSKNQQYVWCYGGGGNGKSAIDRVLSRILGPAYTSTFPPKDRIGFWLRTLLGKRLVIFPDCDTKGFPATGLFKSLCANDAVAAEEKGGATVGVRLGCRFIFLSNELPTLSSEEADARRVIFCELGKPTEAEVRGDFEDDLWAEAGPVITECIREWSTLKATGSHVIPTEKDGIDSWVEDLEMDHQETLEFYLQVDLTQTKRGIGPILLQRYLQDAYDKKSDRLDFLRWLERKHGIRKKTVASGEDRGKKEYFGLFPRPGNVLKGSPGSRQEDIRKSRDKHLELLNKDM